MQLLIVAIFVLGYLAIAFEHTIKINKAASALLIGVICWALYVMNLDQLLPDTAIPESFHQTLHAGAGTDEPSENLNRHFAIEVQHLHQTGEIASILFFLMGAMTIVELIDAHEGFSVITSRIRTKKNQRCFGLLDS